MPIKKLNYNLLALKPSINWSAFRNDFEKVVIPRYPEIRELKEGMLKEKAIFSSLSGSGSTVFGVYENKELAEKANNLMQDLKYQSVVANPIYKI